MEECETAGGYGIQESEASIKSLSFESHKIFKH